MKDCRKIHPLLPLYAENQLFAPEKAEVEKHLALCAEARKELKQLHRLSQGLEDLPEPKIPRDLHAHIMAGVKGKRRTANHSIWLKTTTGLAAAAGLAFIFFAQNLGWFGNSQDALKKDNILSLIRPMPQNMSNSDIPFKSRTQPSAPMAQVEISKPLDARLTVKSVNGYAKNLNTQNDFGTQYALKPSATTPTNSLYETLSSASTPPMVLAYGGNPISKKKAMAFNSQPSQNNTDATVNAYAAAPQADYSYNANNNGQNETALGLNYQAQLPDLKADQNDKQTPKFLQFETVPIGLSGYELNWQTDLVTKGQIVVLDSTGNTLQAASETGQYAYDHQMNIDTSKITTSFSFKLIATYLNGNQAVTVSQPVSVKPAP